MCEGAEAYNDRNMSKYILIVTGDAAVSRVTSTSGTRAKSPTAQTWQSHPEIAEFLAKMATSDAKPRSARAIAETREFAERANALSGPAAELATEPSVCPDADWRRGRGNAQTL